MAALIEALQQSYFQRALIAGLLVGVICPAIGVYLVLRRLSLIGDGLGHVSLAGVTAGWLAGLPPLGGAAIFATAGAIAIERLRAARREHGDMALAVVFYGGIALGVVLAGLGRRMNASFFAYLFGSILTVTESDLVIIGASGFVVVAALALFSKELLAVTFDEELARVSGLPVQALNYLVVFLAAITVVAALPVVGTLLVAGLLVIPVAASLQIARSFHTTLLAAMAFGAVSALLGLVISYTLDLAPGGAIVLTAIGLFLLASLAGRVHVGGRDN